MVNIYSIVNLNLEVMVMRQVRVLYDSMDRPFYFGDSGLPVYVIKAYTDNFRPGVVSSYEDLDGNTIYSDENGNFFDKKGEKYIIGLKQNDYFSLVYEDNSGYMSRIYYPSAIFDYTGHEFIFRLNRHISKDMKNIRKSKGLICITDEGNVLEIPIPNIKDRMIMKVFITFILKSIIFNTDNRTSIVSLFNNIKKLF